MFIFQTVVEGGQRAQAALKGKSTHLFEELLNNENLLRKVFESDLIIRGDSSNSLIQANTPESNANIPTFEEFAKPWWHWDTCPYVLARRAAGTESHPGINKSYVTCNELWTRKYLIPGMRYELTEELACAIGFDLIYRGNYFILGAIGEPTIKGKIIDGVAKDVIVCYDISPNGLDKLPSEAAIAYAHRGISAAYFANCVEGMTVIEPEKRFV